MAKDLVDAWNRAASDDRKDRAGDRPSGKCEWAEREVVGGTESELEVRSCKTKALILVTADSRNQENKTPIQPGEVRRMAFTSVVAWAGAAFSVSSEHAHLFVLESMQCARMEFMPDQGIACTLLSDAPCVECRLSHVKRHLPTSWPTVFPGTHLTMVVKNIGDQPSHFRGTFEAVPADHHPCL